MKKLTRRDYENLWGEDGPYSQVRLCEETRILDDAVSRVFLVVEAEINPFTFEYVAANYKYFLDDEPVLQLLDHAEYRGKFGYVVGAGETELKGVASRRFAKEQADVTIQTLIRMHAFVMKECGLVNDANGKAIIGSRAGVQDGKMRFFIVLPLEKDFVFKKGSLKALTGTLDKTLEDFRVTIENCEAFFEYILLTVLLPMDVPPGDFVAATIRGCNSLAKKSMFQKDYLITNTKEPSPRQIMSFLGNLPLHKDKKLDLKDEV